MEPCKTCGSTGEWECIDCGLPRPSPPPRRRRRADPARKAAYQKEWYARNRERILAEKRAEYEATKDSRPKPPGDARETTLYRFFDREGRLLYVGITSQFPVRLTQHRRLARWFESVDRWSLETYPTRRAAKRVETQVIREEMPRFNRHESIL